jgi:hypothetical protein
MKRGDLLLGRAGFVLVFLCRCCFGELWSSALAIHPTWKNRRLGFRLPVVVSGASLL